MMRMWKPVALAIVLGICVTGGASAQFQIKWYSINSGGGLMGGGAYKLNGSIGQSVAGFVQNTSYLHWIGFWAGDVPTPTVASTVSAAKLLADGTYVSVSGKLATSGATDYSGFFYVEERDRSSGMRVSVPSWPVAGLVEGSVVNVIGTMGTTASGERQITATLVIITSSTTPIRPLGMNNRALGGGDYGSPPLGQYGVTGGTGANNVGLLIVAWGKVSYVDGTYMLISDGSGDAIRVDTTELTSLPAVDDYISVIGASSLYLSGGDRLRFVLPRRNLDVIVR